MEKYVPVQQDKGDLVIAHLPDSIDYITIEIVEDISDGEIISIVMDM